MATEIIIENDAGRELARFSFGVLQTELDAIENYAVITRTTNTTCRRLGIERLNYFIHKEAPPKETPWLNIARYLQGLIDSGYNCPVLCVNTKGDFDFNFSAN